ncbi:hypothetical protein GYA49_06250 [Candidatus Beckwithbacteria bacterium]|nr:hypothetical protein [Candidatus Beckwithbacteria bacterium]
MKKQRITNRGSITGPILVITAAFIVVIYGLVFMLSNQWDLTQRQTASDQALAIAEAGIQYYRWHLAHSPDDFTDGTGHTGPYIHSYKDSQGKEVGSYSLLITPPENGSSLVTLTATGWVKGFEGAKRTITASYGIPSLARYSNLSNASTWYGEGITVHGLVHSNNGIRMDGINTSLVTSAQKTYTCGSETGCSPTQTKPGVWGSGPNYNLWQYPTPTIDFDSISVDFDKMRTAAKNSGVYRDASGVMGYHVVFQDNGTFSLFRVESADSYYGYSDELGCQRLYQNITTSTPQPTPQPTPVNTSLNLQPETAFDDWEIDGTTFYANGESGNALATGQWNHCTWGAARFTVPAEGISANATVSNSTISLYSQGTNSWNSNQYLSLYITDAADAPRVSSATGRPNIDSSAGSTDVYPNRLSDGVRWPSRSGLSWPSSGYWANSISFDNLIQYLVDKYNGLSGGSHIVVWITDPNCNNRDKVEWLDRNAGLNHAATLNLEYTTPAPPPTPTPTPPVNPGPNQTYIGTYQVSDVPIIFLEDTVWVDGTVNGKTTLVAARFPIDSNAMDIWINGNITYHTKDGNHSLGLIAQHDIYFIRDLPEDFEVDAALLAQKGAVLRHGYLWYCGWSSQAVKNSLTIYGTLISNNKSYWNFGDPPSSGFYTREMIYDGTLLYYPPPYFPTEGEYEFISWQEE